MSDKDNVQVVKDAYAAFGKKDIPGILDTLSEDVEWNIPGPPDTIPFAGRKRGRDEVRNFFTKLSEYEETTHFEPREFVVKGERVVVLGNYKARVRSTKREYDLDWVHVFAVREGKIKSFDEYLDTAALTDAYSAASAKSAG